MIRRSVFLAMVAATLLTVQVVPATGMAVEAPPVDFECTFGRCEGEASNSDDGESYGHGDTATPVDEDPVDPGPAVTETIADAYRSAGLDRCLLRANSEQSDADREALEEACDPDDPEDAPSFEEIVTLMSSAYVRLPIAPSPITHQPGTSWALVNKDFIVFTDDQVQVFEEEMLGLQVTFRAAPVHYSWDFGDGSPALMTSSAGAPYPDHDLAHVYSSTHDGVQVELTTTWQGEFQIGGSGPWYPVASHATTVTTADPVEIVAMDVHLVPNPDD